MFARWLLAAFGDEILDAFFDVGHPLLLLRGGGRVHGEGLAAGADEPAVAELALVFQGLKFDLLRRSVMGSTFFNA